MSNDRYRFKLGDFECLAICDINQGGWGTDWFPNIPPEVSRPILEKMNVDPDDIQNAMTCLAVNTGTEWVLLDTGMGFVREDAMLAQILKQENIQPSHIMLTHLDLDHYAGLITTDNTPAFPDAQIHICRDAWEQFTSDAYYEANKGEYDRREHLSIIKGQVQLVEWDKEFLPGFRLISLPGHRDHHAGIAVESNGEKLLFAGDVVVHPLHIEYLDWHCKADSYHDVARETRIKFAQLMADNNSLSLIYHFEFPGLGRVIQDGDGWKWQPLEL